MGSAGFRWFIYQRMHTIVKELIMFNPKQHNVVATITLNGVIYSLLEAGLRRLKYKKQHDYEQKNEFMCSDPCGIYASFKTKIKIRANSSMGAVWIIVTFD